MIASSTKLLNHLWSIILTSYSPSQQFSSTPSAVVQISFEILCNIASKVHTVQYSCYYHFSSHLFIVLSILFCLYCYKLTDSDRFNRKFEVTIICFGRLLHVREKGSGYNPAFPAFFYYFSGIHSGHRHISNHPFSQPPN